MSDVRTTTRIQLEKLALTWANTNPTVPDEAGIRAMLQLMRGVVGSALTDEDVETVFDAVTRILSVQMDLGVVIEGAQHKPWLDDRRGEIDWRLWNAYAQYLGEHGRGPVVIDQLNRSLEIILDHMGNPADPDAWERRGLVIGDVQSGKTSTYIGLMDKAADAGYRIFIVLTGNTESLRRQTQERVDEGMIGRDSAAALLGAKRGLQGDRDSRVGIGLKLESTASVASTTTVLTDFRKSAAEAMNIQAGESLSVVFITKKNKVVLGRIADWLESQMVSGVKLKQPLLFLDDEADYASINTNKEDEDPTAINQAIRRILATSSRNAYIGFTATPFANIFINDEDNRDLFPRDFIYALEAPSNYLGAAQLFGSWDGVDDEAGVDDTRHLRILEDADEFFPASHKNTLIVDDVPESLKEALRTFLIVNAIRDLQGASGTPRSMLVNVSRFNAVQARVGEVVAGELAAYRNAINSHYVTFARGVPNEELESLRVTFLNEFGDAEFEWPVVLEQLPASVAGIEISVVNSLRDKKIETEELRDPLPRRQISIGGDLLSRGLTLEGLIVSYFYRRTAASDTLMQMGRWFGYRDGYADLSRLWLSAEVIGAYAFTADSLKELRLELTRMRDERLTPQQYGLAVRNHPGTLLITARNKMRSAQAGQKSISLRGRQIESAALSADPVRVNSNLRAASTLLSTIHEEGLPFEQAGRGRKLWRAVRKAHIALFLKSFAAADSAALFYGDALAQFAKNAQADDLQAWDVVLMGGTGSPHQLGPELVNMPIRSVRKDAGTWLISSNRRRVAGPGDIATPISVERRKEIETRFLAEQDGTAKRAPDTAFIRELDRPVLLLYPIQGQIIQGNQRTDDFAKTPLLAVALAVPGSSERTADSDQVTYMLNAVAQKLWFQEFDAGDEDDDEY